MIPKESFGYITSDKNRHFTDALVNNASEYENFQFDTKASRYSDQNLAASGSNVGYARSFIVSAILHTATLHDWTVSFWSKDINYQNLVATPYDGALMGFVHLNAAEAWAASGSEFFYATAFQAFPYQDEDNTNELHIGLHNRSTATKGALGAALPAGVPTQFVTMKVGYVRSA